MSLSIEIKKQLGTIIKNNRKYKYDKTRNLKWFKDNPYSKDNLCKDICHYHTLTKLEEDYILNDEAYYLLLNKLGFSFRVSYEVHINNMKKIRGYLNDLLKASEFLDDDLMNSVSKKISESNFQNDCIAHIHIYLLRILTKLHFFKPPNSFIVEQLEVHQELFSEIYKGVYQYVLGIIYLNQRQHDLAFNYLVEAQKIFEQNKISLGLVNTNFISIYMIKREYLKMVNLCLEMETFFINKKNHKRLLHVYYYLSDYFLIINSFDLAEKYYNKSLEIVSKNKSLERYYFAMEYNWGLYLFKKYEFHKALEHMKKALGYTSIKLRKLQIINVILFLMTKLKVNKEEIISIIEIGKECYDDGFDSDKIVLKYFIFKYEKNYYYRKYATNKLIPLLKKYPESIDLLLIVYQDLCE